MLNKGPDPAISVLYHQPDDVPRHRKNYPINEAHPYGLATNADRRSLAVQRNVVFTNTIRLHFHKQPLFVNKKELFASYLRPGGA